MPSARATGLQRFLDAGGRLRVMPSARADRLAALHHLAAKFEDREHTEREVNDVLNAWATFGDPAWLRREMFEAGLLARDPFGRAYRVVRDAP